MAENEHVDSRPGYDINLHDRAQAQPQQQVFAKFKETAVPPSRFWILASGIYMGLFLSMIDTSIIATCIYDIGLEFEDIQRVNWVALAYTLSYLSCAVTFARVSDVIGRRSAFLAAYAIFLAFSFGCGFAQSLEQLIAFRALQGIGGSGLLTLTMIILPELCPQSHRKYIGTVIGAVVAGSGILGPVLGGVLARYATWRWVFWIKYKLIPPANRYMKLIMKHSGPIAFVSILISFLSWPKADQLPTTPRRTWKQFDFLGSLLIIAAAVLVVFSFQNAGESHGSSWDTTLFLAPLVIGLVLWICLVAWGRAAPHLVGAEIALTFPVNLFRNRVYAVAAMATLFLGYPYFLLIFSFPLRAQIVEEKSPLMAGVMLLPMLGATAVGSIATSIMSSKKNYLFEILLVGSCIMTLGFGLLTLVNDNGDNSKALGFIVFAGLGYGLTTSATTMMAIFEVPISEAAPAQGIISQMRILGGSLGISTSTVFFNTEARKILAGILNPEEQATLGQGGAILSEHQRDAVHRAYSLAFRDGMIASAAVTGAATLITLLAYRRGRRQTIEEQQKARVQQESSRMAALHRARETG